MEGNAVTSIHLAINQPGVFPGEPVLPGCSVMLMVISDKF